MATETTDKRYPAVMRAVFNRPWAIEPDMMRIVCKVVIDRLNPAMEEIVAGSGVPPAITARVAAARSFSRQSDTAVIPIQGVIVHHAGIMEDVSAMVSTDTLSAQFKAAIADDSVKRIVLDVDSPGGSVDGVPEFTEQIMAARGTKPVVAVANSLMGSAAFWISAAADEIVVTPSGQVGSVGVVGEHIDFTEQDKMLGIERTLITSGEFKREFDGPLSEGAMAELQSEADRIHDMFVKSLARGRGTTANRVRSDFGRGRVVGAPQAVESGMADRIATLDEVLGGGAKRGRARGGMSRARVEVERRRVALRRRNQERAE